MKREYTSPEAEIEVIEKRMDVLTASGGENEFEDDF